MERSYPENSKIGRLSNRLMGRDGWVAVLCQRIINFQRFLTLNFRVFILVGWNYELQYRCVMSSYKLLFLIWLLLLTHKGMVVGITDGDTIKVLVDKKEIKIRLDCPESGQAFGNQLKNLRQK